MTSGNAKKRRGGDRREVHTWRAVAEVLEPRRLLSTITWTNRNSTAGDTDNRLAKAFGTEATAAQHVIDAAISAWQQVIISFNRGAGLPDNYILSISASSDPLGGTGTGIGAVTTDVGYTNGKPSSATISINYRTNAPSGDTAGGWYLDPTPTDNSEFTGLDNGKANAFFHNGETGGDLYTAILHELGHAMGLSANDVLNAYGTRTILTDDINTPASDPVAHYYTFDSTHAHTLWTEWNSAGGADGVGPPSGGVEHAAPDGISFGLNGRTYSGYVDVMNAQFTSRSTISDNDAFMLEDAFNYSINLPSTFGTFYDELDADGTLRITAPAGGNDFLTINQSGNFLQVFLTLGNRNVAVDPQNISSVFAVSKVKAISINTGDGDDTVYLGNMTIPKANVNLGAGNDTLVFSAITTPLTFDGNGASANSLGKVSFDDAENVRVDGTPGDDTFYLASFGESHLEGLINLTINGNNGIDALHVAPTFGTHPFENYSPYVNYTWDPGGNVNYLYFDLTTYSANGSYDFRPTTISASADGNYFVLNLPNTAAIDNITLNAGSGKDDIAIDPAVKGTFHGGDGNDTFTIGGGNLGLQIGTANLYGDGGSNTLVLDDSADTGGCFWAVNDDGVHRETIGVQDFYTNGFASVEIRCSPKTDDITFEGTIYFNVTVLGNGGDDRFHWAGADSYGIAGDPNNASLFFSNVTLDGGPGTNSLTVDDAERYSTYYTFASGAIDGTEDGLAGEHFSYANFSSLTLNGSDQPNVFTVGASAFAAGLAVTINGDGGDDALYAGGGDLVGLVPFTYVGGAGSDSAIFDNTANTNAWTYDVEPSVRLTSSQSDGFQRIVTFPSLENLVVNAGSADDVFAVYSGPTGTHATLSGGGGDDTLLAGISAFGLAAGNVTGDTAFLGGLGTDAVIADDRSLTSSQTYTINATAYRSAISGTFSYDLDTESFTLYGPTSYASTFNVRSIGLGGSVPMSLYGGSAGGDSFGFYGSTPANASIFGGGGIDGLGWDDSAALNPDFRATVTATAFMRDVGTPEAYFRSTVTFDGIESFGYLASTGTHDFEILGTPSTIPQFYLFSIFGNAGDDYFHVRTQDDDGNATINGDMAVYGNGGNNTLFVDGTSATSPLNWQILNYAPNGANVESVGPLGRGSMNFRNDIQNVTIAGGAGDDYFDFQSMTTGQSIAIQGNGGNDHVDVARPTGNISDGFSSIGNLSFDGGDGYDSLYLYNGANASPTNYTFDADAVTALSGNRTFRLAHAAVDFFSISGGSGVDDARVHSTPAGSTLYLDLGGGADSIEVNSADLLTAGIRGQIAVSGDGADLLTVRDTNDTVGRTVHFDGYALGGMPGDDYFGPGGYLVIYGPIANAFLYFSQGADTVFAQPTYFPMLLHANGPGDSPGDTLTLDLASTLNPVFTVYNGFQTAVSSDNLSTLYYENFENDPSIDVTPPTVGFVNFNADPGGQGLSFYFSEPLAETVGVNALTLVDISTGEAIPVDYSLLATATDFYSRSLSITFPGYPSAILPAGLYRATLSSSLTTDRSGNGLAADYTFTFLYAPAEASLTIAPGGTTYTVNKIAIDAFATCDLTDNSLIYDYTFNDGSPSYEIGMLLGQGYNGGGWDGIGLTSSTAAADPEHLAWLGYAEASDVLSFEGGTAAWHGVTVGPLSLLIGFGRVGDTDLSGEVDGSDLSNLFTGRDGQLAGWVNGDMSFDGVVDEADRQLLMAGLTAGSGAGATPAARPSGGASLVLTSGPGGTRAGELIGRFGVQVLDGQGNVVSGARGRVRVSVLYGPEGAKVRGTATALLRNGRATFSGINFAVAGTYTLELSAEGFVSAYARPISVTAGAAAKAQLAMDVASGVATVTLSDKFGNRVTDGGATALLLLTPGSRLGRPVELSSTLADGLASFSSLPIVGGKQYMVTARVDKWSVRRKIFA